MSLKLPIPVRNDKLDHLLNSFLKAFPLTLGHRSSLGDEVGFGQPNIKQRFSSPGSIPAFAKGSSVEFSYGTLVRAVFSRG
jgi:hypothetical protein